MFGFSFSELIVVVIVALVVMGPKDLPKMLRRLGQWAGKIRRAASDLRAQSGIDDALRSEGLADDIAEIRKLARGELDAVRQVAQLNDSGGSSGSRSKSSTAQEPYGRDHDFYIVRDREYPRDGADAYNSLPDNAILYAESLPKSKHARDALYRMGDENAELPIDPEPTPLVGPTLMGIGVSEMEESERKAQEAADAAAADANAPTGTGATTPSSDPLKTPIGGVGLGSLPTAADVKDTSSSSSPSSSSSTDEKQAEPQPGAR